MVEYYLNLLRKAVFNKLIIIKLDLIWPLEENLHPEEPPKRKSNDQDSLKTKSNNSDKPSISSIQRPLEK